MRDPERIGPTLEVLRRLWEADPDLRLGQLIVIGTRPKEPCPEVFSIEDDKLLAGLEQYESIKK